MISFLRGVPVTIENDLVVLDVNGVGYAISVPTSVSGKILENLNKSDGYDANEQVMLFTYMYVREDNIGLYGFDSKKSLQYFKYLINVNGIGPRGALSILSTMTIDDLIYAVLSDDSKSIAKAPGIGAKTAVKVILELKDKIDISDTVLQNEKTNAQDNNDGEVKDTIMALTALGYSKSEAMKAIGSIDILPDMKSDDILKLALKAIMKLGF